MPASIGVNLRVTGHCRQGGRKYMEDFFSVAYQQTEDEKDLEFAFFGIYDGHGGGEAATFAKEHLMEAIVKQKSFWSDQDEDVLKAIKEGYIATHYAMWHEQDKWPKTASGLPSTAGTTASVAFIRRGKIYTGHVGDSGIILGYSREPGRSSGGAWQARPLTSDHKPENAQEMLRIEQCGGKVVTKSGVSRVVWNKPRSGHRGPVRRSTPIDEIPFLAVARSLGDLWSYNSALDEFVVSPDPDVAVVPIDTATFRCLIFGTDGLWNMISPQAAVAIVQAAEQHNERTVLMSPTSGGAGAQAAPADTTTTAADVWINPSKSLVDHALERWNATRMRADNTSVVTLMLDPPGPPRAQVIRQNRSVQQKEVAGVSAVTNTTSLSPSSPSSLVPAELQQSDTATAQSTVPDEEPPLEKTYPANGLEILTRFQNGDCSGTMTSLIPLASNNNNDNNKATPAEGNLKPTPAPKQKESNPNMTPPAVMVKDAAVAGAAPNPCTRCMRSHVANRPHKSPPSDDSKPKRASSESPRRSSNKASGPGVVATPEPVVLLRQHVVERDRLPAVTSTTLATGKREHDCSDEENEGGRRLSFSEPPQKLLRSRSLGPRECPPAATAAITPFPEQRNLRERNVNSSHPHQHSLRQGDTASGSKGGGAAPPSTARTSFSTLRSPGSGVRGTGTRAKRPSK